MARFYRCGNPDRGCELSKTKDVVSKAEWEAHCALHPACELHGEEVSWKAPSPKTKLVIGCAAIALVAVIAFAASRPDPLKTELAGMQAEVHELESRLDSLEQKPQRDASRSDAEEGLAKLPERILASEGRLATAVGNSDAAGISREKQEFARLKQQRSQWEQALLAPATGSEIRADAGALVSSYQESSDRADSLNVRVESSGKASLVSGAKALQEQIAQGLGRASKLARSGGGNPGSQPNIPKGSMDAAIARFEATLGSYIPAAAEPFPPEQATLKIAVIGDLGDKLILPLLQAMEKGEVVVANKKSFFSAKPAPGSQAHRVIVETLPAGLAFDRLVAKQADLVISNLPPDAAQRAKFSSVFAGETMDSHSNGQVIAMDGLTFVVHPDSSMESLAPNDLQQSKKFLGGIEGSGEQLAAAYFGIFPGSSIREPAADAVLANRDAIGVGLYHQEGTNIRAKRLAFQAAPNAAALKPSPFTIATEDYKFALRVVAWNSPASTGEARDLVKFTTSTAGQDIVSQQGFVDLRLRPISGAIDPRIMAALGQATGLKKISGAQRLSANFRFASGEDRFDLKALGDLERVPSQVARDFSNSLVVILGFTDSTGGAAINGPLSQRRAETVAVELRRSGLDAKTAGMGDQMPIDSNSTEDGKARNRRSEIWIVTP